MKLYKRLLGFIMACSMAIAPATALAASEQVDIHKSGSVTVTIRDREKGREVAGGSLLLYKIAELKEADKTLSYELDDSFADFEYKSEAETGEDSGLIDITDEDDSTVVKASVDVEDPELVKAFTDYIVEKKLEGKVLDVDENGLAKADNLKLGLYLIMQDQAAEGYAPINPFLLTIPMEEDGKVIYDVDASPKVETKPTETEPSTEPPTEPPGNPPGKPGKPHLPQTGQLWWPVPILAFAGLLFFTIGWKKRYKQYE